MTETNSKPVIDLLDLEGLGLIIPFPSGVIYTNQVGGHGCYHPEIEGVFVPLRVEHKKILFDLQRHFNGSWHHLQKEDAKIVDGLLRKDGFDYLKVDQSKLEESFEAWIYVNVDELPEIFPIISGFGQTVGVLTWANSD